MGNLYSRNRELEEISLSEDIKKHVRLCNAQKIQLKINKYLNIRSYEYHRKSKGKVYVDRINKLFSQFIPYLDSTKNEFIESFIGNYQERIFELISANFINNHFQLKIRSENEKNKENHKGLADLSFTHNNKPYLLDCVTRSASLMDQYIKQLPYFDTYFKVATIFQKKFEEFSKKYSEWRHANWFLVREQIWGEFILEERRSVLELLNSIQGDKNQINNTQQALEMLAEWVSLIKHGDYYFRDIIPAEFIERSNLILPKGKGEDLPSYIRFLAKCVAQIIRDKLGKSYFNEKIPVIIFVSLATMPDYMLTTMAFNALNGFEDFSNLLKSELGIILARESSNDLSNKMQYLYAVIIDTTWYNWFPDLVEKQYGAQFRPGYKNCYFVIYNKNISAEISCDPHIFDTIIERTIDWPVSNNSETIIAG